MALKRADVPVNAASTKAESKFPELILEDGDTVSQFASLSDRQKRIEEELKRCKQDIQDLGLPFLYEYNTTNPDSPTTSVKLVQKPICGDDEPAPAEAVLLSFTAKYSDASAEAVDTAFSELFPHHNVNRYVVETVAAKFDSNVFLNEKGGFSKKKFDAFKKAIDATAEELGVPSPLTCARVVKPKDTFHTERWKDFTKTAQAKLRAILPNTVSIKALRAQDA